MTLVLGLNPAWQRYFSLDALRPGEVHRLAAAQEFASGKGINCSRILQLLGGDPHLFQFVGGLAGQRLLADLESARIAWQSIPILSETRICTTLGGLDGLSTELIEPSPQLRTEELEDFFADFLPYWDKAQRVVLCGSAPQGFDWERLCALAPKGRKLYVDACQGIESWLQQGVTLLKLNTHELRQLLGFPQEGSLLDWVQLALRRWPLQCLVVTQGKGEVYCAHRNGYFRVAPPCWPQVRNCIGAGDSFLAAWVNGERLGLAIEECLAHAVAVSSVRCLAHLPWELDLLEVQRVQRQLRDQVEFYPWKI